MTVVKRPALTIESVEDTVNVTIDHKVAVVVGDISVIALVKLSGAVAVGMFWTAILVKWFG